MYVNRAMPSQEYLIGDPYQRLLRYGSRAIRISTKGALDMKTSTTPKTDVAKLDISVKAAGLLGRAFTTPAMQFNKV